MGLKRLFTVPENSSLPRDLLVAIVAVATAAGLRGLLHPVLYERGSFLLFGLAVMLSSWMGGRRVGLVTTALATAVGLLLFVRTFPESGISSLQNEALAVIFASRGLRNQFACRPITRAKIQSEARGSRRHTSMQRDLRSDREHPGRISVL